MPASIIRSIQFEDDESIHGHYYNYNYEQSSQSCRSRVLILLLITHFYSLSPLINISKYCIQVGAINCNNDKKNNNNNHNHKTTNSAIIYLKNLASISLVSRSLSRALIIIIVMLLPSIVFCCFGCFICWLQPSTDRLDGHLHCQNFSLSLSCQLLLKRQHK